MGALLGRTALLLVLRWPPRAGHRVRPGAATAGRADDDRADRDGKREARAPSTTAGPATSTSGQRAARHEDEWRALDRPGRSPLQDVCIDRGEVASTCPTTTGPPRRVVWCGAPRISASTEDRGRDRRAPSRLARAGPALWRARRQRPRGQADGVGRAPGRESTGADEAWQAAPADDEGGTGLGSWTSSSTVVRVGNAVIRRARTVTLPSPTTVVAKGRTPASRPSRRTSRSWPSSTRRARAAPGRRGG